MDEANVERSIASIGASGVARADSIVSARGEPWAPAAEFGTGWEAELAVARLDAEGIPARALGNDLVGIFGPGFQGATARGYRVEVPVTQLALAQMVLHTPPPFPDAPDPA